MQAKLDHVVLWVADPLRSLEFYEKVVGLTPVRADEFREQGAVSKVMTNSFGARVGAGGVLLS